MGLEHPRCIFGSSQNPSPQILRDEPTSCGLAKALPSTSISFHLKKKSIQQALGGSSVQMRKMYSFLQADNMPVPQQGARLGRCWPDFSLPGLPHSGNLVQWMTCEIILDLLKQKSANSSPDLAFCLCLYAIRSLSYEFLYFQMQKKIKRRMYCGM